MFIIYFILTTSFPDMMTFGCWDIFEFFVEFWRLFCAIECGVDCVVPDLLDLGPYLYAPTGSFCRGRVAANKEDHLAAGTTHYWKTNDKANLEWRMTLFWRKKNYDDVIIAYYSIIFWYIYMRIRPSRNEI